MTNHQERGVGTSHAKIILIGEHSVVYGQPAIALPLKDIKTKATLTTQADGQTITSRYFQGKINELPDSMAGVGKLIAELTKHFAAEDDSFELTIESDIPAERGMGSSAATAVAITRAFFDYYRTDLSRKELLKWADVEEQITHRSPSGLDAATVSSDSPLWFIKGQAGSQFSLQLDATMVIADTGIQGATKEAINAVKQRLHDQPESTNQLIEHLGQLATITKSILANNEVMKLGTVLNAAQNDLGTLGVSDASLDHLIDAANQNGALGAKLTGGGRGGCMFAITHTAMGGRKLAAALTNAGAKATWIQPLGGEQA
ncbi:mevalonate kinase [Limosilactobacillus secaliphilus]|uniref:mevalonate kinase n=1 Tax=Limosilactobacillus secaliphilus TaxID=396268 RepID=UPI00070A6B50|nr:mevalonate kinase [Limosilactobacillus secaliphilus]